MASINLGRIGFVNKGTYLQNTAYKINDVVEYSDGSVKACIVAHTSPSSGITDANWRIWVESSTTYMTQAVYDTTASGIVDNAEKVNNLTVETAVPAGAKFTDTVYTLPSSVVHDTEKSALHASDALRSSGSTVSLYKGDGTYESVTLPNDDTIYTHPTYAGDDINIDTLALSGATVISDLDFNVTTDTLGHVTDANATVATRELTLADLGYTGETNATADQTAAEILALLKTVDVNGTAGVNAGTLDGLQASEFLRSTAKASDSSKLDGLALSTGRANVANQVVRTNGSGYLEAGLINTTSDATTNAVTDFYVNTNDGYIRKASTLHAQRQLGVYQYVSTGAPTGGLDGDIWFTY